MNPNQLLGILQAAAGGQQSEAGSQALASLTAARTNDFPNLVSSLADIIGSPQAHIQMRQLACLELKNTVRSHSKKRLNSMAARWLSLPQELREKAKAVLLQALGAPEAPISTAASYAVAQIALIEIPRGAWNNILSEMCNQAATNQSPHIRRAAMSTVTEICHELFSKDGQFKVPDSEVNIVLQAVFANIDNQNLAGMAVKTLDVCLDEVEHSAPHTSQSVSEGGVLDVLVDVECLKEGEIEIVEERSEHSVSYDAESGEREGGDLEAGSASGVDTPVDTPASGHKAKLAFLGTEEVYKLVLKIGIPSMVSFAIMGIYGVVDSIFIGRMVGAEALTAISVFFVIENSVINGPMMTLCQGVAPMMSRALGAGDKAKANMMLTSVFVAAFLWAVLCPLILLPFLPRICTLIGVSDTVMPYALQYGRVICGLGSGAFWLMNGSGPLLRVENRASLSMVRLIVSSCMNAALDALFMGVFKWGITGAALATVCAQYTVGGYLLWFYASPRSSSQLQLMWTHVRHFQARVAGRALVVGSPHMITLAINGAIQIGINTMLQRTMDNPDAAQAGYGLGLRVFFMVFYGVMGMEQAMVPVAGFNRGAKQYRRVVDAIRTTLTYSCVIAVVSGLGCVLASESIAGLFSSDPETIQYGSTVIKYILSPVFLTAITEGTVLLFQIEGNGRTAILLKLFKTCGMLVFAYIVPWTLESRSASQSTIFHSTLLMFPVTDILTGSISIGLLIVQCRKILALCSHVTVESDPVGASTGTDTVGKASGEGERHTHMVNAPESTSGVDDGTPV
ncbi:multi antimicrobial extrusion protein [Kipferlia bialata]|uniref:Multi antimicrobial extrusion protein n=1 Tax=Kipferlia bialata TaxID=797122 RepID=A0A9K3CQU7_9EUKA|nr:multi antimicrobial extrusion protein [Kipferlia bialata]|eukprot:g1528.t1